MGNLVLAKGTKFLWGDGGAGAVKATKTHGTTTAELVFTAKTAGTGGNSITVAIVNPGGTAALSVSVTGSAITINAGVSSGSIISTANDVIAKIYQTAAAAALVDVTTGSTGLGVVAALAAANLTGGSNSAEVFADIPRVGDISFDRGSFSQSDVSSHSTSGNEPEMLNDAFKSPASISFAMSFDNTDAGHLALESDFFANTVRNAKLVPPAGGGSTATFSGQIMSLGAAYPVKGVITRDVKISINGSLTWA